MAARCTALCAVNFYSHMRSRTYLEHSTDSRIDVCHLDLARIDEVLELRTAPSRWRGHLQVESGLDGGVRGVSTEPNSPLALPMCRARNSPIRHDKTVKFPFSPEKVLDQPLILGAYTKHQ